MMKRLIPSTLFASALMMGTALAQVPELPADPGDLPVDPGSLPADPGELPVPVPGGDGEGASPCCAVYDPCADGQFAKKNGSPGDAQCCELVDDDNDPNTPDVEVCSSAPNAGYACEADTATNVQAIPDRTAIAGCAEAPVGCIGGMIPSGTPGAPEDPTNPTSALPVEGCAGVNGMYEAGSGSAGDTAEACTASAVAACCAGGACI